MRRKDEYKYEVQKLISPALALMGNFLTMANEASEEDADHETIEKITDAAKLLCEAMYQCTVSRKLSIEPRFGASFKRSVKKTTPEGTLYGPKLEERMNKINKDHKKLLKNHNSDKTTVSGNSGNYKRQLGPQPPTRQAFFNQGGSGRQNFFSRRFVPKRGRFPKKGRYQQADGTKK